MGGGIGGGGTTVIHLEPEAAFATWSRIEHSLKRLEEIADQIERTAKTIHHFWEAPAAWEMTARLRGLARQYRRTLDEIQAYHRLLHQEYRQWLSMDGMDRQDVYSQVSPWFNLPNQEWTEAIIYMAKRFYQASEYFDKYKKILQGIFSRNTRCN